MCHKEDNGELFYNVVSYIEKATQWFVFSSIYSFSRSRIAQLKKKQTVVVVLVHTLGENVKGPVLSIFITITFCI